MIKRDVKQGVFPLFPGPVIGRRGFTLVELLVVISLVGILAGVMISIINPVKQRKIAEDGVRTSNLQKLALGIESYANANGNYPEKISVDTNNVPEDPEIAVFISRVPNDEPTKPLSYVYESTDGTSFGVAVPMASDSTKCFKYHSSWGKIKHCLIETCGGGVISSEKCE